VQDLLGETNKRIVQSAMAALAAGDMKRVGELMIEAQAAFDKHAMPMCPSQLTAPNLHKVLAHAPLNAHIWGGKGVGSQGDGCAQLLCRSEADVEHVMRIVETDLGMSCMPLQIGASRSVNQALIPAASFSQALFPASKCLPPALFPILDTDGLLKPAILILVEEALAAGLQHVVIVVAAENFAEFETIFHKQPSIRDYNRLPPRLQQYADKIVELGQKVQLVVQEEQHGLGHAVLCAKGALQKGGASEPFVLMLGDHLYRSSHERGTSCLSQLLEGFQGRSLMALRRTSEEFIHAFGCVAGRWEVKRDAPSYKRITISTVVEKPTKGYARANLATPGLKAGEYLTAFGLYVITEPSLFTYLEEMEQVCVHVCAQTKRRARPRAQNAPREGRAHPYLGPPHSLRLTLPSLSLCAHEQVRETVGPTAGPLQLTPALDKIRQEVGLDGLLIDGERYDIGGEPHTYLTTLNALAPPVGSEEPMGQPFRSPSMRFALPASHAVPANPSSPAARPVE